jgi:hypothetical protein
MITLAIAWVSNLIAFFAPKSEPLSHYIVAFAITFVVGTLIRHDL